MEMEKSFRLPIRDDNESESDETVELVLSPGNGIAELGPKAIFTIHDDDKVTIQGIELRSYDVSSFVSYTFLSFTFNSVPGQVL